MATIDGEFSCGECDNLLGEECEITGLEVYDDTLACGDFELILDDVDK
jgi:hypothetical protein